MKTRIFSQIFNLHPGLALPASIIGSPLDARAMRLSTAVVENAFRKHRDFEEIARPFHRFFEPARPVRAAQALKKALHLITEERMRILALRADPPTRHGFGPGLRLPGGAHPLDEIAWDTLGPDAGPRPRITGMVRFRMLVSVAARAARLLFRAASIGICFGRARVMQQEFAIGAPAHININAGAEGDWRPLEAAAREAGLWPGGAVIAVIDERGEFHAPCSSPVIRVSGLPVPRRAWLIKVVLPSMRLAAVLFARTLFWAWRDALRTQLAYEALVMAEQSLLLRRLFFNCRFRKYLSGDGFVQGHIVKAMLLEAEGGRLVRWGHTMSDTPGAALSFLGYHEYHGFGPYERGLCGRTWPADQIYADIGMVRTDKRFLSDSFVAPEHRAQIEGFKTSGGRLMVFFLPSFNAGMEAVVRRTLEAVIPRMAERRKWLLVVKSKGAAAFPFVKDYLTENKDAFSNNGMNKAVFITPGEDGAEVCSTGWLLTQMDVGIGVSTVQFEGLVLAKPVLQYYPVLQETPFIERARAENVAFDDAEAFSRALGRWMDDPALPAPFTAWCRRHFDPFTDGNALGRIARLLLPPPPQPPE